MNSLFKKPATIVLDKKGKFEQYNLCENPFPSEPTVNKESSDKRINGNIYEIQIRRKEFEQIENNFLKQPQNNPNHLRLGFIIDSSYTGRGNGKSAFLVYLQQEINKNYCMDISNNQNKCFSIYLSPEPGGRTKLFISLVDLIFDAILKSHTIRNSLGVLRFDTITELYPKFKFNESGDSLIDNLNNKDWFTNNNIDINEIENHILKNRIFQDLPSDFPLYQYRIGLWAELVTEENFKDYYINLKRGKERLEFLFTHIVKLFLAAGFNGAYFLIDDFERIPDFQSSRQKKDFALELRTCLYDGTYLSSKLGFYNFFIVLHAGVQRLINDAWSESGMENRAPLSPSTISNHIILFEKLSHRHVNLLLKKYLEEYRIKKVSKNFLNPFLDDAITRIGELSEYNASKILKLAYNLLDKAADENIKVIDNNFINNIRDSLDLETSKNIPSIEQTETVDLNNKIKGKN